MAIKQPPIAIKEQPRTRNTDRDPEIADAIKAMPPTIYRIPASLKFARFMRNPVVEFTEY
jgi:hypothetical protein